VLENSRTVLIADDDEFFRMALSSLLSDRLGFSDVIQTNTFDAAVEQLTSCNAIELALFDLNMPGMNNGENLKTIRETFPEVRVAVVSGSRDRNDILMALDLGMHGYINKGLGISELAQALQLISEGGVYLPPFFPDLPREKDTYVISFDTGINEHEDVGTIADFTPRQREVLKMLVEGKSNKAMARVLNLSEGTIKFHISALFRVLGAANRVEAATAGARLLNRSVQ
jgi:DNA-binding NarL/FixJ family response regulator